MRSISIKDYYYYYNSRHCCMLHVASVLHTLLNVVACCWANNVGSCCVRAHVALQVNGNNYEQTQRDKRPKQLNVSR